MPVASSIKDTDAGENPAALARVSRSPSAALAACRAGNCLATKGHEKAI